MMKYIYILMLFEIFSTCVLADESEDTFVTEVHEPSSTQKWLELQRSGKAASTQAQPISGEVMDKVHQRYIKSFERPIPEFYEHEMPATR
jgi:hypothetical protein